MIRFINLSKKYGSTLALDQLNLTIPAGSIFGLLGPNGSGKSTLLKLLMGFTFPTSGQIERGGLPISAIGYLPERVALPMNARLIEYVTLMGRLANLSGDGLRAAVDRRMAQVGLSHARHWRIAACSKGMLQRLALAASLLGNPRLLVLDEPMSGLDPAAQHQLRQLIRQAHAAGATILLSSHQLADVAELCTDLAILKQSRLMRSGALDSVLTWRNEVIIHVRQLDPAQADDLCARFPALVVAGSTAGATLQLHSANVADKDAVLRALLALGLDIVELKQQRSSLEEIYLEATR